jgi:hypothetical protein
VDDAMKGKLMVMTIITGVHSPYITGSSEIRASAAVTAKLQDDLGIEVLN